MKCFCLLANKVAVNHVIPRVLQSVGPVTTAALLAVPL